MRCSTPARSKIKSHYSNPQVDALLEQARTERDVTRRLQLYQQAEQIIVDDAAVLFTTHGLSHVLVKPYVQGYVLTPIDVPLERYLSIDARTNRSTARWFCWATSCNERSGRPERSPHSATAAKADSPSSRSRIRRW